jgi:alpha-1,6-mannosyltransferase
MHLVDVTLFYPAEAGGVRTYIGAKRRWLARHTRVAHSVVAPKLQTASVASGDTVVSVPSVPIPGCNGYRMPLSSTLAARAICRLRPDLIEVGDPYQFAWSALRAGARLDVPVIAFYHSDLPQLVAHRFGLAAQRAAIRYTAHLYRQFDLVLAPSAVTARRLRNMGVNQVQQQPLGVDTTIFSPQRKNHQLRAQLGLPPSTRLLVYAGRFTREKKLPLLIEAVERLGDPYHLLLIGSGGELPASPRVTLLPFQRDARALASLIAGCDALVHPGDQETFGLVVLEAMACGIPVVGVQAAGVGELVERDTGVVVEPGSAPALADGIERLYRAERESLGANARRKVLEKYDWDRIMPQLMQRYARLLATRASVAPGAHQADPADRYAVD